MKIYKDKVCKEDLIYFFRCYLLWTDGEDMWVEKKKKYYNHTLSEIFTVIEIIITLLMRFLLPLI